MKHCEKCKKPTRSPKDRFCGGCEKYMLAKMENEGYLTRVPRPFDPDMPRRIKSEN